MGSGSPFTVQVNRALEPWNTDLDRGLMMKSGGFPRDLRPGLLDSFVSTGGGSFALSSGFFLQDEMKKYLEILWNPFHTKF